MKTFHIIIIINFKTLIVFRLNEYRIIRIALLKGK